MDNKTMRMNTKSNAASGLCPAENGKMIPWRAPVLGEAPQLDYSKRPEVQVSVYDRASGDLLRTFAVCATLEEMVGIKKAAWAAGEIPVIEHIPSGTQILQLATPYTVSQH